MQNLPSDKIGWKNYLTQQQATTIESMVEFGKRIYEFKLACDADEKLKFGACAKQWLKLSAPRASQWAKIGERASTLLSTSKYLRASSSLLYEAATLDDAALQRAVKEKVITPDKNPTEIREFKKLLEKEAEKAILDEEQSKLDAHLEESHALQALSQELLKDTFCSIEQTEQMTKLTSTMAIVKYGYESCQRRVKRLAKKIKEEAAAEQEHLDYLNGLQEEMFDWIATLADEHDVDPGPMLQLVNTDTIDKDGIELLQAKILQTLVEEEDAPPVYAAPELLWRLLQENETLRNEVFDLLESKADDPAIIHAMRYACTPR